MVGLAQAHRHYDIMSINHKGSVISAINAYRLWDNNQPFRSTMVGDLTVQYRTESEIVNCDHSCLK